MLKWCLTLAVGYFLVFSSLPAEAAILTFRCDVLLHWAKSPMQRLVVVDTQALTVQDGELLWQDHRSNPPTHGQMQHVVISTTTVEWGASEIATRAAVDRYRIDLGSGLYRYDNELRGIGRGQCKRFDLTS